MKHLFLTSLSLYWQCINCGYVDEVSDSLSSCCGCGKTLSVHTSWFPDEVYEYAILLEDYHSRPPSDIRRKYLHIQAEQNMMDYFCSTDEPEFKPVVDWKPITVLLYRSIFELLVEHFLWHLIKIQLLPSPYAEKYANYTLEYHRRNVFTVYYP